MLEVIGAGYSRTGTLSLKLALQRLGIGRCYHFTELMKRRHTARWLKIYDGADPAWNALFAGYSATVDWPAASFWRELADHYPDAKVILTVRDPQAWHRSLTGALLPLREALPRWLPWTAGFARLTDLAIWQGTFKGRANDRDFAIDCFLRHADEVRAAIDADRLLVYDVSDGWEPLCRFLDRPVPDAPFPRTNSRAKIRAAALALRATRWLLPAAALIGLLALATTLFT